MSRRDVLWQNIEHGERLITEYEAILRDSSRPEERLRAERILDEQRKLIRQNAAEYRKICRALGENVPERVLEWEAAFGPLAEVSNGPPQAAASEAEAPSRPRPSRKIRLFYSYAHEDEILRDHLEDHLSTLRRTGVLETWNDRAIGAGREWAGEIDENLERADIILLLVSSSFLASDYCWDVEVKRAMERHEAGAARVIPVILRPVVWEGVPFAKLQALPKDAKAVTLWPNQDEAFFDIALGIRRAVAELQAR